MADEARFDLSFDTVSLHLNKAISDYRNARMFAKSYLANKDGPITPEDQKAYLTICQGSYSRFIESLSDHHRKMKEIADEIWSSFTPAKKINKN